jgi:hypothetical protein
MDPTERKSSFGNLVMGIVLSVLSGWGVLALLVHVRKVYHAVQAALRRGDEDY